MLARLPCSFFPASSRMRMSASGRFHPSCVCRRHELQWLQAAAGGGDGGAGGSGGSGGSGGGGGGDDEPEGQPEKKPVIGWKGWQDRVAADPQFVYKVMIEQVIGVTASVIGDMASRPNWGLNELDFVFATLVVSGRRAGGAGAAVGARVDGQKYGRWVLHETCLSRIHISEPTRQP